MDILDYFNQGKAAVEPVVEAMKQRRAEAIAQQLLAEGHPELAQDGAVRNAAAQSIMLQNAMAAQKTRQIQDQLLQAKVAELQNGKPLQDALLKAKINALQNGGGRAASGPRALAPESAANQLSMAEARLNKPAQDEYARVLAAHIKEKLDLEKSLGTLTDEATGLAGQAGQPLDSLMKATKMWRANDQGVADNNGAIRHIETPTGNASIAERNFPDLFTKIDELKSKQKRLAELQPPPKPEWKKLPAQAAALHPQEVHDGLDWAAANPDDPRAARLMQQLGGQ